MHDETDICAITQMVRSFHRCCKNMKISASPLSLCAVFSVWTTPVKACFLFATIGLIGISPAEAAVIPYTNDFSGVGSNTAFPNEVADADWSVSGGTYNLNTNNTSFPPSTSSIELTNLSTTPFTMETQFSISSTGILNANGETIGMGLFGLTSNFGGASPDASSAYYLADWQIANSTTTNVGTLRILSLGNSAGFTGTNSIVDANASTATLAIDLNTTYTMRLVGTYVGSTLNMTLSILDASGVQIGTSATAADTSPLTGTYFGYRNRIGISGGAFAGSFDNFSVIPVPEPGTVALLGLSAGAVLLMIRKRSRLV